MASGRFNLDFLISLTISYYLNFMAMEEHQNNHITPYTTHLKVLIALLLLTFLTIEVATIEFGALTVTIALLLASLKVGIVLTWFMHLKYEQPIFRIFVIGVFALFALIIFITFFDYAFR